MKKEKTLSRKQKAKQAKKRADELKSTLDWMDIQDISATGITIKRGSKLRYVKGIVLRPVNIYLVNADEKVRRINGLANAMDKIKFPVYFKFIKTKPKIEYQINRYTELQSIEKNEARKKMIQLQLNKLDWFRSTFSEVVFYALVKDDEDHIDKAFSILKSELIMAGFLANEMTVTDYENIVKQEFENDNVNEYMFTQLLSIEGGIDNAKKRT